MRKRTLNSASRRFAPWTLLLSLAWSTAACGVPPDASQRAGAEQPAGEAAHAVILLYHHVSEETPPSTSVTPETFQAHLDYLAEHDYTVVPLSRVMGWLAGDADLPPRAVAITFDDAYDSVYRQAAPLLEARDHPFAVFVSTDYIDQGFGNYMSWEELRELEQRGAEMGNHSRDHSHYVFRRPEESRSQWRGRIARDMGSAQARLDEELERPLAAIAYPYGEFSPAVTAVAEELGLMGFGQQSGPVGPATDAYSVPRFPMATSYAALEDFAEKLRTRPFQVDVLAPDDPVLAHDARPPTLRLSLTAPGARLDALSCFVTGQPRPSLKWLDREAGVVEVTAEQPLPAGRSKYTCTAPASAGGGVFYWYSHLWMKPPAPGEWYAD